MVEITGIKAVADQSLTIPSPNGDGIITMRLLYRPRVQTWFADIQFNRFTLNGRRLCVCPNLLSQFRNIVNFGLLLTTQNRLDPFLLNDFSSGNATLVLLSAAEVEAVEAQVLAGRLTG